ncbi:MAG: indoleacetamide hydrolase [Pararhodobacter sp.]|nr:indoleacetamide hydrolase [Pararhodobacter sp.]
MPPMPHTASELLAAFDAGTTSARDHAEAVIESAAARADLGAVLAIDPDALRAAADAADASRKAGRSRRLEGLALGLKDNIDTTTLPTTGGTGALRGPAPTDAPALARLTGEGALAAAKCNLHELAFGITSNNGAKGAVHNPWKRGHIPGGSSGGTAAAVAAGIVPAGLGTDTGGSVRIPAALCGIKGFRPTTGRYPAGGVVPLSATRDTIGPLASTIADLALLDGVMAADTAPLAPRDAGSLRLGVPRRVLWDNLETGVADRCEAALEALARAGVTLIESDPTDLWADDAAASFPIVLYECMRELDDYCATRGITLQALIAGIGSPDVRGIIESQLGEGAMPEAAYRAALDIHRPEMQRNWATWFAEHRLDGAIFPTTPLTACAIGLDETVTLNGEQLPTFGTYIRNTDHGSLIGAPGISLPAGLWNGLPVGIEIDGLPGQDRALLDTAAALETILQPLPPCPG